MIVIKIYIRIGSFHPTNFNDLTASCLIALKRELQDIGNSVGKEKNTCNCLRYWAIYWEITGIAQTRGSSLKLPFSF